MKVRSIVRAVESLREIHGELTAPLGWTTLRNVLEREGIMVTRAQMQRRAHVFCSFGVSVVVINSNVPNRSWVKLVAHEYGHIKLHLVDESQEDVVVRNLSPCQRGDPREYEAELFARLILGGPSLTIEDDPRLARLAERIERRAGAEQLQLTAPMRENPPSDPDDHLDWILRRARAEARRRPVLWGTSGAPLPESEDTRRIEYRDGAVIYTGLDDRRWRVYDVVFFGRVPGKRKSLVPLGAEHAKARYFVNSIGERRRYLFRPREKRAIRTMHLDRQIHEAIRVRTATTAPRKSNPIENKP